ncbi:MAG: hypothetical protein WD038_07715 [Balneolales bacterium]
MNLKKSTNRKGPFSYIIILLTLSANLTGCNKTGSGSEMVNVPLSTTVPVAWDIEIQDKHINKSHHPGESDVADLALIRLYFTNLPPSEEGNSYTLIGGGLNKTGLHGPNSTGFEGIGYHFADPKGIEGDNSKRDVDYMDDYTRTVREGQLNFEIYYKPTNLNEWGEQYIPGSELAITLTRSGTSDRVLYSNDNESNWTIVGVGKGNAADIIIDMAVAEYTWHMDL